MSHAKNCSNCARGVKVSINQDILCRVKGIVSRDFICTKYLRIPETWSVVERRPKCGECVFFITSQDESDYNRGVGYCQLFTVRYFNGETKSACSKFCRNSERNIS